MSKLKKAFYCQSCGFESAKWLGKCPSCAEWNTFQEEITAKSNSAPTSVVPEGDKKPIPLNEVKANEQPRILFKDQQYNRVLGGGMVPGAVMLLGGEPGVGKSTLLLQNAIELPKSCAYVSGEESPIQIKLRADRINQDYNHIHILTETVVEKLLHQLQQLKPEWVIIDSIQTLQSQVLDSVPGSISQIRACTGELVKFAKLTGTPVVVVGHINKDGQLAGPKVLEHMVDVVMQFEGDTGNWFRLLRAIKNRFGSVHEIALYEMQQAGLNGIENPGEYLISNSAQGLSGVALGITLEGLQPLLLEVQALVSVAAYGTPQRSTTGFDVRRLNMLLAVLEKRCGFKTGMQDVFLNIAGGFKTKDTALDLAVVTAILSSRADMAMPDKTCFLGEVGLSGEIRPVVRAEQRLAEAARLGYKRAIISSYQNLSADIPNMEVKAFGRLDEFFGALFA